MNPEMNKKCWICLKIQSVTSLLPKNLEVIIQIMKINGIMQ